MSASSSSKELTLRTKMERLIECAICLQYYSDVRRPRLLTCGHSFCTPCLRCLVNRGGLDICSICRQVIYVTKITQIPLNYTLDSMVPLVKQYLGITCNSKQTKKKEESLEGLKKGLREEIEKELKKKMEKDIKERVKNQVKEETTNISRKLKDKLENENKEKIKRLHASTALMKKELDDLKELSKNDKSEVTRLMRENKLLRLQKKSVPKRNEKKPHYRTRSSVTTDEIIPLMDITNTRNGSNRRYSTRSSPRNNTVV